MGSLTDVPRAGREPGLDTQAHEAAIVLSPHLYPHEMGRTVIVEQGSERLRALPRVTQPARITRGLELLGLPCSIPADPNPHSSPHQETLQPRNMLLPLVVVFFFLYKKLTSYALFAPFYRGGN